MDTRYDWNIEDLEGVDVDIEISLKEYGFAWISGDTETLFYYGIKRGMDSEGDMEEEYTRFDFCTLDNNIDVYSEYDWADFNALLSFTGQTKQEFDDMPLVQKIHDLIQYYGHLNIFGETYWEGLTYEDIVEDPFVVAFEKNTKGLHAISSGFSAHCEDCRDSHDICCEHRAKFAMESNEIVDEPSFSWRSCETCGSRLAGDRQAGHALDSNDDLVHLNMCTDCILYVANGDLPENWRPA